MKRIFFILSAVLLCFCLPMRVSAASEGDVYAALRSIGVPESYVSQAAGMLARGTSDGAGVYRSDGTYYSYSAMVSYIYANRETILLYCGIDPDTGGAVTSAASGSGSTESSGTASSGGSADGTDTNYADTTETTSDTVTETTTAVTTTTASTTRLTASRTRISTSGTSEEAAGDHKGGMTAAAVCLILAAAAGISGTAIVLRRNGAEQ